MENVSVALKVPRSVYGTKPSFQGGSVFSHKLSSLTVCTIHIVQE